MLNSQAFAAFDQLQGEHIALVRQYGAVQQQCSHLLQSQRADIARLEAQVMRLRSAVILRDTALAVAREDRARAEPALASLDPDHPDDLAALEASLAAADLVICQTGCLSHGAYWRVQDHCKRSGKTCVIVDQPQMIRIVRGLAAAHVVDARPA